MKWFSPLFSVLICGCASGTPTFIQSLGALGANDEVLWSQFTVGTNEGSPLDAQSLAGLAVTASLDTTNGDGFTIYQEQTYPWSGNFTAGDVILGQQFSDIGSVNDPLTLTFASPVYGAGFQVEPAYYGPFTVELSAYDASNNFLGEETFNGMSESTGDGSAIFIGVMDNLPDISYVTAQILTEGDGSATAGLGIDSLYLSDTLPEPATFGLVAVALGGFGAWRRFIRTKPRHPQETQQSN